MASVRKSLIWSFAESYVVMSLQFVTIVVLSRILTPAEFGIFSVAAALASLASTVRDFGVGEYLIQERELTADKIRAAFTLNIIVSWSMAALLLLIRHPVADFYREPGVARVMAVLALNFTLIPFGAVTMACFRRQMNFKPLTIASLVNASVATVVAITLGTLGFGYMSMAWSLLAGTACTVLVANWLRPPEVPMLPGIKGIRAAFSFGAYASGMYLMGQLGRNAPDLIIGRAVGMEGVGLFGRANGLIEVFFRGVMRGIGRVALPYFSAEERAGRGLTSGLVKAICYTTGVGWPFFAVLALLAYPSIRIVYGAQWDGAVLPLQILCLAFAIQLAHHMAQEVLIAAGRLVASTKLQAKTQLVRISCMLGAAPFGLIPICIAFLLASIVTSILAHLALRSVIGISAADMVRGCRRSAQLALITALPAIGVVATMQIDEHSYLLPFALASALGAAFWLGGAWWIEHPLVDELKVLWRQAQRAISAGNEGGGRR